MKAYYIDNKDYKINNIRCDGFWYEYTQELALNKVDFCLATKNPEEYCNGYYIYSSKDPGSGVEFIIINTNNPELESVHKYHYKAKEKLDLLKQTPTFNYMLFNDSKSFINKIGDERWEAMWKLVDGEYYHKVLIGDDISTGWRKIDYDTALALMIKELKDIDNEF
ncbi:MAG: hypothetical protein ACOC2W_04625 [bacterium]